MIFSMVVLSRILICSKVFKWVISEVRVFWFSIMVAMEGWASKSMKEPSEVVVWITSCANAVPNSILALERPSQTCIS